jgi:N4-gp56 family major capsid protein
MLAVGSGSFTTIGFQTSGKSVKWKIQHKAPADNLSTWDPYAETGFYSLKYYYGFMALRPEWIGLYKVVAEI